MKIQKKHIIIIIISFIGALTAAFIALFIMILSPWLIMLGCSILSENPPVPQVKYAEFPFELEYEVDGKITKVEDVVICKYDGIGFGDSGKFLKWKKWVASTGEEDFLILSEENKKIFCTVGEADYYMGEIQTEEVLTPIIYIDEREGSITNSSAEPEKLEKYNIKIINYKFTQPIKNKFE